MAGPEVISVYRSILKAAHKTFRGDISTLSRAKEYARSEFRSPLPAERTTEDRVAEAKEVAQFLRKNFVQAARSDDNYYKLNLTAEHEINDKIEPIKTKRRCC